MSKYWDIILVNGKRSKSCPIWECKMNEPFPSKPLMREFCKLNKRIDCRYGLTEINVPKKCPLKRGEHTIQMVLNLTKEKIED